MAPSFASFRAVSSALTRSIVARNRFSSFGNSHRKSALSRTSCHTHRQTCFLVKLANTYSTIAAGLKLLVGWEEGHMTCKKPVLLIHKGFLHKCEGRKGRSGGRE